MSNFEWCDIILVGSVENEQSFAGNKVLLKQQVLRELSFRGKPELIFENTYLYDPVPGNGKLSVRWDYKVKKKFCVICVTRLDIPGVDVENTYLALRKRFRLKKEIRKKFR